MLLFSNHAPTVLGHGFKKLWFAKLFNNLTKVWDRTSLALVSSVNTNSKKMIIYIIIGTNNKPSQLVVKGHTLKLNYFC